MQSFNLFGEKVEDKKVKTQREKSASAYRTISEVADSIGVATHVLRFWETKFSEINPIKRQGGRRSYRPEDVQIITYIHDLLHNQGYTIKGVQTLLKSEKKLKGKNVTPEVSENTSLKGLVAELKDLKELLTT